MKESVLMLIQFAILYCCVSVTIFINAHNQQFKFDLLGHSST